MRTEKKHVSLCALFILLCSCKIDNSVLRGAFPGGQNNTPPHVSVWTHPTSLADNISNDGEGAYYTQTAMDSLGNIIVVWMQRDLSSNYQIFTSVYL